MRVSSSTSRRSYLRQYIIFVPLLVASVLYILSTDLSSDFDAYQELYLSVCSGEKVKGFEAGFTYYLSFFGYIFGCSSSVAVAVAVFWIVAAVWIFKLLKTTVPKEDLLFVFSLYAFYVVSYQLAYNFRTGMATILALLSVVYFLRSPLVSVLLAVTSISFHIQVLVFFLAFYFFRGRSNIKLLVIFLGFSALLFLFPFFKRFVFDQGMSYLLSYAGSVRVSGLLFMLIAAFCFWRRESIGFDRQLVIFISLFVFFINLLFFWNSHLSARLLRPAEPVLMIFLYFALQSIRQFRYRPVSFFVALLPGLGFVGGSRFFL